jgi:hypothetical protein
MPAAAPAMPVKPKAAGDQGDHREDQSPLEHGTLHAEGRYSDPRPKLAAWPWVPRRQPRGIVIARTALIGGTTISLFRAAPA